MIEAEVKKIGVVFVHGFTGDSNTWKNKASVSFCGMLALDEDVNKDFVFFEFDYYTKIIGVFKSVAVQKLKGLLNIIPGVNLDVEIKKNKPIRYLSDLLDGFLRTELEDFDEVVLVAHSMGGLVAKDYILRRSLETRPRPIGYVSIAVPHKGSLASIILAPSGNVNAKELQPLNEYADSLNTEWYERRSELPKCMYLVASNDECVNEVSSVPYKVSSSDKFTLDYDHTSICKPASVKDHSYLRVKRFLKQIAYVKSMEEIASIEYFGNDNDFNKEIFVIKLILSEVGEMGIADAKASFFHAEIITKASRREDKEHLATLREKVLSIYRQAYNKNKSKSADDIFNCVHDELRAQDAALLKCAVQYINFLHKGGLLHQAANSLGRAVIWDKNVTDDDVKALMS